MDWNRVEGNWKQVKGKVKEKWGKLTDDLDVIAGKAKKRAFAGTSRRHGTSLREKRMGVHLILAAGHPEEFFFAKTHIPGVGSILGAWYSKNSKRLPTPFVFWPVFSWAIF